MSCYVGQKVPLLTTLRSQYLKSLRRSRQWINKYIDIVSLIMAQSVDDNKYIVHDNPSYRKSNSLLSGDVRTAACCLVRWHVVWFCSAACCLERLSSLLFGEVQAACCLARFNGLLSGEAQQPVVW